MTAAPALDRLCARDTPDDHPTERALVLDLLAATADNDSDRVSALISHQRADHLAWAAARLANLAVLALIDSHGIETVRASIAELRTELP